MTNVLVDRHHAGLFYSLQLLGDRLGWDIWTPTGLDWWDEGYWDFGRSTWGDDRLAQQYLNAPDWSYEDGPVTADPEFPARAIYGVTLDMARDQKWDLVVATLQDNQHGFHRFATEVGARFVYQVGNTGQQIDWSLDPLTLVSSEVPILGRGVRYHQEMDPVAFRFRHPSEAQRIISSFVNCMTAIECWPSLVEAWRASVSWDWRIHGIDGPDGVLKPATAIGNLMGESSFGWHDKVHGDGFGHVLFGWAAVGRPVIGHASHYAGKLGAALWEDGVTCIDLDIHTPREAVNLMARITENESWHAEMCHAIRARFDDLVDYEAEADAIRTLLEG